MVKSFFWKVDGVTLPAPKSAAITEIDLDAASTGRPESGVLHRERVRHDVIQLSLTFHNLNAQEAQLIRTMLAPTQISVTFWLFDSLETRVMYAGDRKWDEIFDNAGEPHISLSVNLSEY